jgi:hypothetical protein
LLPDFPNKISIVDGFVMPGIININNARNPPSVTTPTSEVTPGFSYNVEVEAGRKLNDMWGLSFSLGIMQIKYDYDTYISQSFYKNDFYLSEVSTEYGNSSFTYLTSRPINVSRTFNRFSIQGGAVLSYLLSKKTTNTVVLYNTNTMDAVGAFFEEKGDAQKLLYGAHLNTRILIAKNLSVMLGGQYFFNSLYKEEDTYKPLRDKSKALQFQLGLSYNFAPIFTAF